MRDPSSPDRALLRYEELVASALTSADPAAAFAAASRDEELTPRLRELLAGVDPVGLRISAVLIARLRFERVIRGSLRFAEWFERDPVEFTRSFRRYHHAVAPTALFPSAEARDFERWLAAKR